MGRPRKQGINSPTLNVPEEKRWAIGLTQEEFEKQWMQRFPGSDVIPGVKDWLNMPLPKYHGIGNINPGDYIVGD